MLASRSLLGIIGLLLALLLIPGCSTVRLGYSQAPDLLYWWIDGYFNVNEAQTPRLRDELSRLHQWHRAKELPRYTALLQKAQQMAPTEVSADQVCALYEEMRGMAQSLIARALEPAAALALGLTPQQLEHLQRKFEKNNLEYSREFRSGSPDERLERRLKSARERVESSYGRLEEAQLSVLRGNLRQSAFDPLVNQKERLRRQRDLQSTLGQIIAQKSSASEARTALAAYADRSFISPDPAHRVYAEHATLNACANVAKLHNSTTAAQRGTLIQWFNGYELDLRSLLPAKS